MSNEITLPELMPPKASGEPPIFRKRQIVIPKKLRIFAAVVAVCVAVGAFFIFNPSSKPKPSPPEESTPPFFDTNGSVSESAATPAQTVTAPPESLPVVLPLESEATTEAPETDSEKETEPQGDSAETTVFVPEGAFSIKEVTYPTERAKIVNHTSHTFDVDLLEVMASAVIAPNRIGATVLVISTHTTECYLPSGAFYYHPSEHKTHSESPDENMTAVAKAFCDAIRAYGIDVVHITTPCDLQGSSRAYINARNEISRALAQNPDIKYVIDIERASDTDSSSNLLRTSVLLGSRSYAPIKLTVSGGGSLGYSRICQNLSFALRLNELISEQSAALTRPVQIADAVYTDGNSPRSLKIEIGSYTSTLDEAVSSAELLAELFSLLLNS